MSTKTLTYLGFALAGGALGAVVGLLTAPASGRETRRRIAQGYTEEKDALLEKGHWAVEEVTGYLRDFGEHQRKLA